VWAGKPTVRRAQLPGGNRMTEKRMPVAERRRETTTMMPVLQPAVVDNRPLCQRLFRGAVTSDPVGRSSGWRRADS